jgi:archaellum component FlaG (FlaF/FlaG flagellin family)
LKKYILLLLVTGTFISCDNRRKDKISDDASRQTELALKDSTTVGVIDSAYNFGKVTDGEKVEYNFRFKNTGSKPLVIVNASGSCGCTVPQKPEKPILPGEIGFIKVVFNSRGMVGDTHKTVTVFSNAKPEFPQLILTGEVIGKNNSK